MPLNNCKLELKLKRKNYCILSAASNENQSDNDNNDNANKVIFTIKNAKLYVSVQLYTKRQSKTIKTS